MSRKKKKKKQEFHGEELKSENSSRRDLLKGLSGASALGLGFWGAGNAVFNKGEREILAKMFQLGEPICSQIDIFTKGNGPKQDCEIFDCSAAQGQFLCSNQTIGLHFNCTTDFNCPKFTCGPDDFTEDTCEGQFSCNVDGAGFFSCIHGFLV